MSNRNTHSVFRLAMAALVLAGGATMAPAVEPQPDWVTLVFPTMVPKAGNPNTIPADLQRSLIEYSYQSQFEPYWKETSYYQHDTTTGLKIRGAYSDTKTYGFIQMPWPVQARASRGAFSGGSHLGDVFRPDEQEGPNPDGAVNIPTGTAGTPRRRHSANMFDSPFFLFYYDDADADGIWTQGESFNDANNNGQWDPTMPAEDFWDSDHTVTRGGQPDPYDPRNNDLEWSQYGGEIFADYNANNTYNRTVTVYINNGINNFNTAVSVNELDMTPETDPASNEGDCVHTIVVDPEMLNNPYGLLNPVPGSDPADGTTIPLNGYLDATSDANGTLQVVGTDSYVYYQAYVVTNQTVEATADKIYSYAEVVKNNLPVGTNAARRTVRARIFQSRELYGTYKSTGATPANGIRVFGDLRRNPALGAPFNLTNPERRITDSSDGGWTDKINGEQFEDFISVYDPTRGGHCYVSGPPPALLANATFQRGNRLQNGSINTRGRPFPMDYDTYTNYLSWNYPGNYTSLIARAYNGWFDGPDNWSEGSRSGKWVWSDRNNLGISVMEPFPGTVDPVSGGITTIAYAPGGAWDTRAGYATWQDWYMAVFGGAAAPAWRAAIPNIARYNPNSGRGANGWTPEDSWGYDSPAEYCDMPSSIYHLDGDYLTAETLVQNRRDPALPDLADLLSTDPAVAYHPDYAIALPNADQTLGEVKSPYNDEIYGDDIFGMMPNWNEGPDGVVSAAGPLCFNTIGVHGYDGGSQMSMELMSHVRTGVRDVDVHPWFLRDTNCDGYLDGGVERTGEANYASGGSDPGVFTWHRYMEDVIEIWDQVEDFAQIFNRAALTTPETLRLYGYPIYPEAENEGWAALGGPSGQNRPFISRDTNATLSMTFQVRPIGENGEVPGTPFDPNNDTPTSDYGMALLAHEQGHDLMGWPDLYDYDVWSAGTPIINTPVAAYDLMAGGGLVHGFPILKETAFTGGPWVDMVDLASLVPLNAGPVTLEFFPIERNNVYYRIPNPAKPDEFFDLWFTDVDTDFGVVGGRGVYISHMDLSGNNAMLDNALPIQQKVNNHFSYELVQADGRTDLQDAQNFGDTGDPFPGTRNMRSWTPDTLPAARWWDATDIGYRIVDIELPTQGSGLPARVTIERVDTSAQWGYFSTGADTDGDGILDSWEFHYFGNLTTANGTSDYDHDGLTDYGEYLAGTDPAQTSTTAPTDGEADTDGDGIPNSDEIVKLQSHPGLPDTDDDGIDDGTEYINGFDPTNSLIPLVDRVLALDGAGASFIQWPADAYEPRFAQTNWTIEALVWIDQTNAVAQNLLRRQIGVNQFNYFVSMLPDGKVAAGFTPSDLTGNVVVTSSVKVLVHRWTHVLATYDWASGRLAVEIDGADVGSVVTPKRPAVRGAGTVSTTSAVMTSGENFNGLIDEIRIWTAHPGSRSLSANKSVLAGNEPGLLSYLRFDDGTHTNGTSGLAGFTTGQIQEFKSGFERDWLDQWRHAVTLQGASQIVMAPADAPVLSTVSDDDFDGMSTPWEKTFAGQPNPFVFDSHLDSDFDGWTSYAEFMYIDGNGNRNANPVNSESFPAPAVNFQFRYSGSMTGSNIVIMAYTTADMVGAPVAMTTVGANNIAFPLNVQVNAFDVGHLFEGKQWFMAFMDLDNDDIWDNNEPGGIADVNPVNVGWGAVPTIPITLTDALQGYYRFSWAGAAANSYTVSITRTTSAGAPLVVNQKVISGRTFFNEADFRAAGQVGLDPGMSFSPAYRVFVYGPGGALVYTNSFNLNYPASLATPSLSYPVSASLRFARNDFAWIMDTNATKYELVVRPGSPAAAPILDVVGIAPFVGANGQCAVQLPAYLGDETIKNNGVYYWQVKAIGPAGSSAWSTPASFTVDLQAGLPDAPSISGEVAYYGKAKFTNNTVLVVQAFSSLGFSGRPEAQVTLTNKGAYTLRGLRPGTYAVRGFMDQNGNRELDAWESWGFVKIIQDALAREYVVPLTVAPSLLGRNFVLRDKDIDVDGLWDAWEFMYWGNLTTASAGGDVDNDGITDLQEYLSDPVDSDPTLTDSDGDGLSDYFEIYYNETRNGLPMVYHYDPYKPGTNPNGTDLNVLDPDTDGDGYNDYEEVALYHTDPINALSKPDTAAVLTGAYPMADTDGDGVLNMVERVLGTDPLNGGSEPLDGDVIGVSRVVPGATLNQVEFKVKQPISLSIRVWVEGTKNLAEPFAPIGGTQIDISPATWSQVRTWNHTHAAGENWFYRINWTQTP